MLEQERSHAGRRAVFGYILLIGAGIMVYALTLSCTWDEGFHLLAAQLILSGKKPYIDFFHAQAPLYAYWNVFWMKLFGESWRTAHAASTIMTIIAACLLGEFTFARMKSPWRLPGGIIAVSLFLFNKQVFAFDTVGQAYGLCLCLSFVAFLLALRSVRLAGIGSAAGSGFCAGAAACSSLLTAALAPILLAWIAVHSKQKIKKTAAFLAAGAVPLTPLVWFFIKAPHQTWFDVIGYHIYYRAANVEGTPLWDLGVIASWLESSQAVLLSGLALLGFWLVAKSGEWDLASRRELYLCGWLAAGQAIYLASTHPTFPRYFLFIVPYLCVPAAIGVYAIGTRILSTIPPWILAGALVVVTLLALGQAQYEDREGFRWNEFAEVARKVNEVTPPGATLWADEQIYFLLHRTPPPGMEFSYSHTVNVDPAFAASVHVLPRAELIRQIAAGTYQTIETSDDDDEIDDLGIRPLYRQHTEIEECTIFWDLKKK